MRRSPPRRNRPGSFGAPVFYLCENHHLVLIYLLIEQRYSSFIGDRFFARRGRVLGSLPEKVGSVFSVDSGRSPSAALGPWLLAAVILCLPARRVSDGHIAPLKGNRGLALLDTSGPLSGVSAFAHTLLQSTEICSSIP